MANTLQYSLDQVAGQLDLPESVVLRLSKSFFVPRRYFQPTPNRPKLLLYQPEEVALLKQIKQELIAGTSLKQLKSWVRQYVNQQLQTADTVPEVAMLAVSEAAHPPEADLVTYEEDQRLNQHLAEATFKQYRLQSESDTAPLETLVQKLQAEDKQKSKKGTQRPISRRFTPDFQEISEAIVQEPVVASKQSHTATQGPGTFASNTSPWMTDELRLRAYALQREILLKHR